MARQGVVVGRVDGWVGHGRGHGVRELGGVDHAVPAAGRARNIVLQVVRHTTLTQGKSCSRRDAARNSAIAHVLWVEGVAGVGAEDVEVVYERVRVPVLSQRTRHPPRTWCCKVQVRLPW